MLSKTRQRRRRAVLRGLQPILGGMLKLKPSMQVSLKYVQRTSRNAEITKQPTHM